jgi:hypothetical protein
MPRSKREGCNPETGSDLDFLTNEFGYGGEQEERALNAIREEQKKNKPTG